MRICVFAVLVFILAPVTAGAQMDVWPDPLVSREVFRIPLWMPPFTSSDESLTGEMQRLEQVVFTDLEFSGLFQIIRQKPTAVGMGKENYSVELFGRVTRESDGVYFEGGVTEVASGDFLGGKKYKLDGSTRRIAHHFADEIVRLVTGDQGIASTQIVFVHKAGNQWELMMSDYDGYNPQVLVRQGSPILNPRWCDGNRSVMYTSFRENKADIYVRILTDSKSTPLASYPGVNDAVDWSDRTRTVLASLSKDGDPEIYLLEPSGAIRKRLTHNRAIDTSPCWAPSGREVAFISDRSGSPQIYVMEKDGGNVRRLTYTGGYNASPTWSPRGDVIAFVTRLGNEFQIATITVDGREGRLVTKDGRSHEDPRWAPNGRHIVYSERGAGDEVISVIDTVTGGKRILAQGTNPDWSSR